jgi:hypothetical protein
VVSLERRGGVSLVIKLPEDRQVLLQQRLRPLVIAFLYGQGSQAIEGGGDVRFVV